MPVHDMPGQTEGASPESVKRSSGSQLAPVRFPIVIEYDHRGSALGGHIGGQTPWRIQWILMDISFPYIWISLCNSISYVLFSKNIGGQTPWRIQWIYSYIPCSLKGGLWGASMGV